MKKNEANFDCIKSIDRQQSEATIFKDMCTNTDEKKNLAAAESSGTRKKPIVKKRKSSNNGIKQQKREPNFSRSMKKTAEAKKSKPVETIVSIVDADEEEEEKHLLSMELTQLL